MVKTGVQPGRSMSQPHEPISAAVFERMDAKARQVIERRFRVRLTTNQSGESQQAAWDVYQNTTVKILEILNSGAPIQDPEGYAATLARNRCYDYWRDHSPDWYDLKGRLYRFLGKQPMWTRWKTDELKGWVCSPAAIKNKPMAEGRLVTELLEKPRRINARALPKTDVFQNLDAKDWDRLLTGVFDFLGGPLRLDELVSIAGVLFGVRGSRELAFEDLSPDPEGGRAWEPPGETPDTLDRMVIREQLSRLWAEIKSMPRRWAIPFLLNPPSLRGGAAKPRNRDGASEAAKPERGEIEVFTANGLTTVAELAGVVGFNDRQYALLWASLGVESRGGPALDVVPDAQMRFGVIWNFLPLDDDLIARLMELESSQKVINLRTVAKNHLAKVLIEFAASKKSGGAG